MVNQTRSRAQARTRKNYREEDDHQPEHQEQEQEQQQQSPDSVSHRKRPHYEETRAQRIKENTERLKSLGILDLASKLKPTNSNSKPASSLRKPKPLPPPSRRSSRLKDMPQVSYFEKKVPKGERLVDEDVMISIPRGKNTEIYSDEHEELLGSSQTAWTLYVDGFDEEGHRIYDPIQGKSCHQCRQKTVGLRTECSKCQMASRQFCGDCLYMRYGENVTEVNQNPEWICPLCRGICNCSRCRREKGWAPTGTIYGKVKKLGFKSVAHYLIHTCRGQSIMEVADAENQISVDDGKGKSADSISPSPLGGKGKVPEEMELDDDPEYGGESDEDDGNVSSESGSQ